MTCPKLQREYCEQIDQVVSSEFCATACENGKNLQRWKNRRAIIEAVVELPCDGCKYYKASCNSCLLLTRQTNLVTWFRSGRLCPLVAQPKQQPKVHPAKYKKIFMRSDGSPLNLIDMYHGQTAFICAGGPSFKDVDKTLLNKPGIVTMAVNNTAHLFRPTFWTGQDPQYKFMPSIWLDPKILKFTLFDYRWRYFWDLQKNQYANTRICDCPGVVFHKRSSDFIASEWLDKNEICWGTPKDLPDGSKGARSVLVAALHILYYLGFEKVYLVGVDFNMDDKNKYWFEQDRTPASIRNNHRVFEHVNKHMIELQPYLLQAGFKVYNCNANSGLKAFPYYSLDKAIEENTISLADSTAGMYERDLTRGKS